MTYLCEKWTEDDFIITLVPLSPRREGDFFVVEGDIEVNSDSRLWNCHFSHLMLKLTVGYTDDQSDKEQDIFHLTNREFKAGKLCKFYFEGEYAYNMDFDKFEVKVVPSDVKLKLKCPGDKSKYLKIEPVSAFEDRIFLGGKSALIHRGDIVLVDQPTPKNIFGIFEAIVRLVTRSNYHHVLLYDHNWYAYHAVEPMTEYQDIRDLYFGDNNFTITWLRPLDPNTRNEAVEKDTELVMDFAKTTIAKKPLYDMKANFAFLLRPDGLHFCDQLIEYPMKKVSVIKRFLLWCLNNCLKTKSRKYSKHNRMEDPHKYHCSEFVAAAWYKAVSSEQDRFRFIDGMTNCTYVSPADIFDSNYTKIVCTLKVENGKYRLLTR